MLFPINSVGKKENRGLFFNCFDNGQIPLSNYLLSSRNIYAFVYFYQNEIFFSFECLSLSIQEQ